MTTIEKIERVLETVRPAIQMDGGDVEFVDFDETDGVVQLRLKGASTRDVVEKGVPFRELPATFIVNDDVQAAIALAADGVHLGQSDSGLELALVAGLMIGLSASTVEEAVGAEKQGAAYIGAGPVWATPSKTDAAPAIGLAGLAAICAAVSSFSSGVGCGPINMSLEGVWASSPKLITG